MDIVLIIGSVLVPLLVTIYIFRKAEKEIDEYYDKEFEKIKKDIETQHLLLIILLSRRL